MREIRQCGSCGGFCGGGYTDKGGRYHYCKIEHIRVKEAAPPAPMSDREKQLVEAAREYCRYRGKELARTAIERRLWSRLDEALAKYD